MRVASISGSISLPLCRALTAVTNTAVDIIETTLYRMCEVRVCLSSLHYGISNCSTVNSERETFCLVSFGNMKKCVMLNLYT